MTGHDFTKVGKSTFVTPHNTITQRNPASGAVLSSERGKQGNSFSLAEFELPCFLHFWFPAQGFFSFAGVDARFLLAKRGLVVSVRQ
jgi:hypothetical protein